MGNIIQDASGLKYVEMTNGRFARKPVAGLFDGGAWTQIRVCCLVKVEDSGADIAGTPIFAMGLCSGTTNIPGDTTPTNAIGANNSSALWSRNTSGTNERYNDVTLVPWKNVAGTPGTGSSLITTGQFMLSTNTGSGVGSPWFVDIIKGSPNFTIKTFIGNQIINVVVMTYAQYYAQCLTTTPSFTNAAYTAGQTIAFSESNGTLDSAFIYWNQAVPAMRILDWRVVKIA